LAKSPQRWLYAFWLAGIAGFALLHAVHLEADFPNHSPWMSDWAKYTDEGWYANGALHAHLLGNWYLPGEFNPAPVTPVWPFLEWILFCFTGVSVEAARGLAIACFFANLVLSYLLLRANGTRWMALLALTMMVTSPFLYCFSRLAILEPLLTTLTLAALNLAVRLPRLRWPVLGAALVGLLFALMVLTKTTGIFLLPALVWALVGARGQNPKLALRCGAAAAGSATLVLGAWMGLIARLGLLADFQNYFQMNTYIKPPEHYWPLVSLWWSFHGGLWIDRLLVPLAGLVTLSALAAWKGWGSKLLLDPVFGASIWGIAGCVLFMTVQNHPQPRYFAVAAVFCFFMVAEGAEALVMHAIAAKRAGMGSGGAMWAQVPGVALLTAVAVAACANAAWTLNYAAHPEYSFVNAVRGVTHYMDTHPNGNRLLVSMSGDQITLFSKVPAMGEDFGTEELDSRLEAYRPGWFASWNDLDPEILEALHERYSVEQVATFRAFDHPDRNLLVLFKLHPLPHAQWRDPGEQNLQVLLAGDKVGVQVE